jgi:hypothetical protein
MNFHFLRDGAHDRLADRLGLIERPEVRRLDMAGEVGVLRRLGAHFPDRQQRRQHHDQDRDALRVAFRVFAGPVLAVTAMTAMALMVRHLGSFVMFECLHRGLLRRSPEFF